MTWLEQLLPPALVRALGWTLLHSLWQGAVVALALVGLLLLLRGHSARVRYATATAALSLLLLLALATFVRYYRAAAPAEVAQASIGAEVVMESEMPPAAAATSLATVAAPTGLQRALDYFDQNLPVIVLAWLLGLLAMTLRLLGGLAYVQRLRHYRVRPLGAEWQARLRTLSERAGVRRSVALLESARVRVPLVVGHLRPVILLPLGTVTGLSQSYMEAILAHELAHVVRRDYLLNLLQAVAEILFFYHPAAWFITAVLRTERENCCDDVATALIGGNPLTVARALAALAEQSLAPRPTPQLALSAVGPDGSLLGRIRRLARGRTAPTFAEGFMAACVVLAGLVLLSTAVVLARPQPKVAPVIEMTTLNLTDRPTEEVGEETGEAMPEEAAPAAPAAAAAPAASEWSQEPLRILGFSPGGQALARVGTTPISFDTTRNQHMMRWSRQQAGGDGTVTIRRDKKGRLLELYVNGEQVQIANAGASAKDKQLEVIRLRDQPGAAPAGAATDREQRLEELALRMQQATLDGRPPSAADAQELSALALTTAREANSQQQPDINATVQQAITESVDAVDFKAITEDALLQAETELRASLKDATTDDERDRLQDQLDALRDRSQEMKAQLREHQQQVRQDAQQRLRDAQQAQQDAAQARRDAQQARRDQQQMQRDRQRAQHDQLSDELEAQLLADDLIKDTDDYRFALTAKELTVNGVKQPAATQQKYRQLYERLSGRQLDGTRSIAISKGSFSSSTTTRGGRTTTRGLPAPPTSPAPPAGPMGMVGPALPTPPLPPAPPAAPDTEQLRNQLRADGLIGQRDKSFQFQLSSAGMRVNGKAQPAALADKYRRLFGGTESSRPGQQSKTNIQISVSE